MAKTRRRQRRRSSLPSVRSAIVVASPRRAPLRRRRSAPLARRRSRSGGGRSSGIPNLFRKSLIGAGLGLATHAGYLARVPTIASLSAETSLGLICMGVRRFVGGPSWLDEIAEVALVVSAHRAGQAGLAALTGTRTVAGIGADPYMVEGVEDYQG